MRCKSTDGNVPCPAAATVEVFWPGQETVACDKHHAKMQSVARAMGFALSARPLPAPLRPLEGPGSVNE